ncbi:MAG: asparagine synthetase B, partial [Bacteroidota bacterium]
MMTTFFKNRTLKLFVFAFIFLLSIASALPSRANYILLPMDEAQKNHLKSYGVTYWVLSQGVETWWLLNYRGGSFLLPHSNSIEKECIIRGVTYEIIANAQKNSIFAEIADPEVNMETVKLEKAPKVAVYAPKNNLPWDDAVVMALQYAEIPFDFVYDDEVLDGKLPLYDWMHLHHEDFTGQFGKFWSAYQNTAWYKEDVKVNTETAARRGFKKVSQLKLAVAKKMKEFIAGGGFLFAMCSATDTYDIALAADGVDICQAQYDGDPMDQNAQKKLNFDNCLAFTNFTISTNPYEYEHSNIDVSLTRRINRNEDLFTLFEFSAKWDPIPTMLCQNHTRIITGYMGQTTAFSKNYIKASALIMGENKAANEARYIHGELGKGFFTFYGGHDPEDYQHMV